METLVQRLKSVHPTADIRVRACAWILEVANFSSPRIIYKRDGTRSTAFHETVCEVITEKSLRRKCFQHYKVGDILVNRQRVANMHENYEVVRERRPQKMQKYYAESHMFKIIPGTNLVEQLVRDDFFIDDGDITVEDRRHMERLVSDRGVVDRRTFPEKVLDLFCVVRHEGRLYHCYRSLVQEYGVKAIPREGLTEDVYTQADLLGEL